MGRTLTLLVLILGAASGARAQIADDAEAPRDAVIEEPVDDAPSEASGGEPPPDPAVLRDTSVPFAPLGAREAPLAQTPEEALRSGDPARALELARAAPMRDARTLVLIGRAHAALGDPRAAFRFYRRALAQPGAPRREILGLLRRVRRELAVVRIDLQPGSARVTVDGSAAEWERGESLLLLEPGQHELVARARGRRARLFSNTLSADSITDVRFLLPPGDDEAAPDSIPAPRPWRLPLGLERDLALGATGLIGALSLGSWAGERERRLARSCARGECDEGARVEKQWASLQGGIALGVFIGSTLSIALSLDATYPGSEPLFWGRLSVIAASFIAAGAIAIASPWCTSNDDSSCGTLSTEAAGVSLGVLIAQVASFLDERLGQPFGIMMAAAMSAMIEGGIALFFVPNPAQDETYLAYRSELGANESACASIAAGDTRSGRFTADLAQLRGVCAASEASGTLFAATLGIAGGLLGGAIAALLVPLLFRERRDVAVAIGPGTLTIAGRM